MNLNFPPFHDNHLAERQPYTLQLYPQRKDSTETYKVPFTRVVYIERTDFRTEDADDYYGLAPGKTVMLRCVHPFASLPNIHSFEAQILDTDR